MASHSVSDQSFSDPDFNPKTNSSEEECSGSSSPGALRATFRITPGSDVGCPVLSCGDRVTDVTQDLVYDDDQKQGSTCECRSAVCSTPQDGATFLKADVDDGCICPVFRQHNCVRSIDCVENGELVVSVTTTDRNTLSTIVADLRDVGASVKLQRITQAHADEHTAPPLELPANSITEKQRETIELAVELGYYDSPRKVNLSDLAGHLGVSESAVSQRLKAVETKLITELART